MPRSWRASRLPPAPAARPQRATSARRRSALSRGPVRTRRPSPCFVSLPRLVGPSPSSPAWRRPAPPSASPSRYARPSRDTRRSSARSSRPTAGGGRGGPHDDRHDLLGPPLPQPRPLPPAWALGGGDRAGRLDDGPKPGHRRSRARRRPHADDRRPERARRGAGVPPDDQLRPVRRGHAGADGGRRGPGARGPGALRASGAARGPSGPRPPARPPHDQPRPSGDRDRVGALAGPPPDRTELARARAGARPPRRRRPALSARGAGAAGARPADDRRVPAGAADGRAGVPRSRARAPARAPCGGILGGARGASRRPLWTPSLLSSVA